MGVGGSGWGELDCVCGEGGGGWMDGWMDAVAGKNGCWGHGLWVGMRVGCIRSVGDGFAGHKSR